MKDPFNRHITYLRISVTDRCNLRCTYCMPEEGVTPKSHSEILSIEEMLRVAREAVSLGIRKIRITGGEPLVRKGIVDLCQGLSEIEALEELCMTTNGTLLPQYADALKGAGLHRLNISLDTLNPHKYRQITRVGRLEDALAGIDAAKAVGLTNIKLNVVLLAGFNEDEIRDFVDFAGEKSLSLRFIEHMPFLPETPTDCFLSCGAVQKALPRLASVPVDSGVAEEYLDLDTGISICLIPAISCKFCANCDRIRLTADGRLKPCLHDSQELSIKGLGEKELREALKQTILKKPQERSLLDRDHPSQAGRYMNQIGG